MHRAYSLLEVKSIDAEKRILTGIASTPTPDRQGDVMLSEGAKFTLPMPLLWQHRDPIGEVFDAKVTSKGIEIQARIAQIDEPGLLKERLDLAWQSIREKLVKGLSIGWRPLKEAYDKVTGNFVYPEWEWYELSAVVVPANAEATIRSIKSLDVGLPATGTEADRRRQQSPGASGISRVVTMRTDRPMKKSYSEQIAGWEATLAAKTARMDEIMEGANEKGVTLDAAEQEEHDTLVKEVSDINAHIARLKDSEARSKALAKPVDGSDPAKASASRVGIVAVKSNLPPGIRFARYAMCVAASKGSRSDALELAKQAYPDDREIQEFIKTAVVPGTTANTFGPLLQYTDFMGDFVDFLRPGSIIGKFGTNGIPALRKVPFNSRVSTQTAGGSAYWVGQGKPKPLTHGTFGTITLDFHKLATISVLTQEEVKFANPSSEAKVRDDLAAAINARMDQDFVDPANAGTANVKPPSITNGVVATAVSGADADAVRVDFKNLMSAFIAANITPTNGVLIMSAQIALNLSLMLNALGQREFPDLDMTGGKLFGLPVIVSEYLTSLGSPSTGMVVIVNASDIFLADDGGVSIEASGEASLEMDDAPTQDGAAGTGASLVSLWQNNLLGIKAERFITWKKRRAAAAQYLSPVAYTPTT